MSKITQIAEGWFNKFLNELDLLDPVTKELGEKRMSICAKCPVRTGDKCDKEKTHANTNSEAFHGCGCDLPAKTVCVTCQCPGGFW